ncbi:MAG TPA: hypothetical protein VHE60_01140 [Pyrinomonadaceae bacterium]|nr:hypothetical protein [Pyrinomonadaceae bacterium]
MKEEKGVSKDIMNAFEAIEDDVLWVHAKWTIYRQLFATSEERISLLNDFAPDFFQIVHDSVLHDIVLTMGRLTDPAETGDKENLTFEQLIKILEADNCELVRKLTPLLETAQEKYKPFRPLEE